MVAMDSTTAIAVYGAVVATGGLIWQIASRAPARRTVVEVRLSAGLVTYGPIEVVIITMTNRSDHPVRITSAGVLLQDGSGRQAVMTRPIADGTLPQVIAPHDAHQVYFEMAEVRAMGIDLRRPVVAWARSADDKRFTSKPRPVFA